MRLSNWRRKQTAQAQIPKQEAMYISWTVCTRLTVMLKATLTHHSLCHYTACHFIKDAQSENNKRQTRLIWFLHIPPLTPLSGRNCYTVVTKRGTFIPGDITCIPLIAILYENGHSCEFFDLHAQGFVQYLSGECSLKVQVSQNRNFFIRG